MAKASAKTAPAKQQANVEDNPGDALSAARVNDPAPFSDRWAPPHSDEEFVFEGIDSLPAWADRNWAGYDNGPALQLPAGPLDGAGPYTTKVARLGDTVKFIKAHGSKPDRFEVIEGSLAADDPAGTQKPAQVTNASLEDLIRGDDDVFNNSELGADAAAQVAARTPSLQGTLEDAGALDPDGNPAKK